MAKISLPNVLDILDEDNSDGYYEFWDRQHEIIDTGYSNEGRNSYKWYLQKQHWLDRGWTVVTLAPFHEVIDWLTSNNVEHLTEAIDVGVFHQYFGQHISDDYLIKDPAMATLAVLLFGT